MAAKESDATVKAYRKQIAPRLANGRSRESWGGRLPEAVKYGLYQIAREQGKSVSWVMEEVVIDYFKLNAPVYRDRKVAVKRGAAA